MSSYMYCILFIFGHFFIFFFFFFNDTATTEIYTLSLHDALPILSVPNVEVVVPSHSRTKSGWAQSPVKKRERSEEHTSELQSLAYLVCRLLLEKKKKKKNKRKITNTKNNYNKFIH